MAAEQRIESGITRRHTESCAYNQGKKCNKSCSYRTEVRDPVTRLKDRFSDKDLAAVKRWREDRRSAMRAGDRVVANVKVAALWEGFYLGVSASPPSVLASGGRPYRETMVKAMESHWRLRLLKRFGGANAATLTTADVQRFVDELVGTDLAPRTIHNNVMSLRVVFKWANQRGMMYRNPCDGLALPSGEVARDTIVAWPVAEQMLQTLLRADTPAWEVAMWATACLAGLRRGELLALTWSEVDLKAKKLGVRLSYSPATGQQTAPKTAKGIRTVPIVDQLAPYLELARIGRDDDGLVFSRTGTSRPNPGAAIWRAAKLWKAAGLQPLGFHEARHTFASLMLAAGVDLYVVSKLLGHASIQITVDRYGHLVEGAADQARAQFSAYLAAQTAAA